MNFVLTEHPPHRLALEPCSLRRAESRPPDSSLLYDDFMLIDSDRASINSSDTMFDSCWSFGPLPWPSTAPGKRKYLPPCDHVPVPDEARISCFVDDHARRYVMSNSLVEGSRGKIKIALPVDSLNERFCVKEMRLSSESDAAGLCMRVGSKKTLATPRADVVKEFILSYHFGGPLAVKHHFESRDRAYLMFPLAAGSLGDFSLALTSNVHRSLSARAACSSVGATLAQMHTQRCVHLDVSEKNILVHKEAPYFALADFGGGAELTCDRGPRYLGANGIYCAPEALQAAGFVSPKSDMWAFGATLLSFLHPTGLLPTGVDAIKTRHVPRFLSYAEDDEGLWDETATARKIQNFQDAILGDENAVSVAVATWVHACERVDAPLTQLIMQHLMVPHDDRFDASQLLSSLSRLPPVNSYINDAQEFLQCMQATQDVYQHLPVVQSLQTLRAQNYDMAGHLLAEGALCAQETHMAGGDFLRLDLAEAMDDC